MKILSQKSYEKFIEYQQVAALVCDLVDLLSEMAEVEDSTDLRELIFDIKKQKDEIINNPEKREMRFNAGCLVYGLAAKNSEKSC